jgi:hypothetical protein
MDGRGIVQTILMFSSLLLEKPSAGIDPPMLPKDNIQAGVLWRNLEPLRSHDGLQMPFERLQR